MFDGLLRFQISEKIGEFAVSIEHSEAKSVSDPRYRLALCTLAMAPLLCQILNTPLVHSMKNENQMFTFLCHVLCFGLILCIRMRNGLAS